MQNNFPQIQTDRFLLRKIESTDIENIFRGLSHPDVIKFYGISFQTMEDTKMQMDWYDNLYETQTGIWWAIVDKNEGTFYGAAGLNDVSHKHKKGEVGMWLLPDFWGNGVLGEVMPFVLNFGFSELKLHRIEGFVEHTNEKCKRAVEKNGFILEGTMRDCEIKHDTFISLDIYAKFAK